MVLILSVPVGTDANSSAKLRSGTVTEFGLVDVDPENLEAAIEEGEAARHAAKEVFALPSVKFDIVEASRSPVPWGGLSPGGRPTYAWQFGKGADDRSIPPPAYLLRHEIGHDIFVRRLVPSTRDGQYGGDAPDWLDEMAAVAFEGEDLRTVRRRAATRYAREGRLIPLRRFLTMTHPEMEAGSIPASSDGTTRAFEAVSDDTPIFYAMASAFHDFLRQRTGDHAVVAEMAAVVRRRGSLERWILRRTGHDDRNDGIAALDEEFHAWIAMDRGHGGDPSR